MRIIALNRFFEKDVTKVLSGLQRIFSFVDHVIKLPSVTQLHIAVNAEDQIDSARFLNGRYGAAYENGRLRAYPVQPWGFVPPINAALEQLRQKDVDALLLISTEVVISDAIIETLSTHLDEQTLVVGARLEGHQFAPGENALTGATTPWNTLALWSVPKLQRMGFPLIGEALWDPERRSAGVEEVGAISLYQQRYSDCRAKLVEVPGVNWVMENLTQDRQEKHRLKMRSKEERPQAQCEFAKLLPGRVMHVPAR
jgi:hypothetical protein